MYCSIWITADWPVDVVIYYFLIHWQNLYKLSCDIFSLALSIDWTSQPWLWLANVLISGCFLSFCYWISWVVTEWKAREHRWRLTLQECTGHCSLCSGINGRSASPRIDAEENVIMSYRWQRLVWKSDLVRRNERSLIRISTNKLMPHFVINLFTKLYSCAFPTDSQTKNYI